MEYNLGVDIGGTFTDCVVVDEAGELTVGKALSTPDNFAQGVLDAVRNAAEHLGMTGEEDLLHTAKLFFHGCTVGDNTLLTRSGARTGLITTKGFADSIYMMRGRMTEGLTEAETAHFFALTKPDPLVPRRLIGEVKERVDYKGAVVVELDLDEAAAVVDHLVAEGVTAVAVSLLWSIANDSHERALEELIKSRHPDLFVSLSSEVAPYLGEYERTITTVFNSYIGPTISSYLSNLSESLSAKGLHNAPLIMQAYGGVLDSDACVRRGVGLVESGPAAGVVGGQYFCDKIDEPNMLVTDMGGTTFKVGLVRDGRIEKNYSPVILRHAVLATKIWVESIGAGGGSIGWVDEEKGLLKIGPQGAGAKPGPASYGLGGTEPTVSDVDLVLGYLNPDYFLGGRMRLDREAAVRAIQEKVADPLGMSLTEAASGLYRITNAQMADLIRRATVERGHDPSELRAVRGGRGRSGALRPVRRGAGAQGGGGAHDRLGSRRPGPSGLRRGVRVRQGGAAGVSAGSQGRQCDFRGAPGQGPRGPGEDGIRGRGDHRNPQPGHALPLPVPRAQRRVAAGDCRARHGGLSVARPGFRRAVREVLRSGIGLSGSGQGDYHFPPSRGGQDPASQHQALCQGARGSRGCPQG